MAKNVIHTLSDFVCDQKHLFAQYHGTNISTFVRDSFLHTRMEEARQRGALDCAERILKMTDIQDGLHFGKFVQRREVSGDILYPKQRDHSAHGVYNYILGIYLVSNVQSLSDAISDALEARYGTRILQRFCNIWPYASILHDVGYILEGNLAPLSTEGTEEHIRRGARHVHEYFKHRLWALCDLGAVCEREDVIAMTGVPIPSFDDLSISGVADALRQLVPLEKLRSAAETDRLTHNVPARQPDHLGTPNALTGDAFRLWQKNYEYYGLPTMADRVRLAEEYYEYLMYEGLEGSGKRILDHGICSGLILLQYATFYFALLAGVPAKCPKNVPIETYQRFVYAMVGSYTHTNIRYNPFWWWAGVLWATAACALHTMLQQKHKGPSSVQNMPTLKLSEEPLTYIGILADTIQQWDRMDVSRYSAVSGMKPMQGTEVKLRSQRGKVYVKYPQSSKVAKEVKEELDRALNGWRQYVVVT